MGRKAGELKVCDTCPWRIVAEWAKLPRRDREGVREFMQFLIESNKEEKHAAAND